jgi:hypothetical protein
LGHGWVFITIGTLIIVGLVIIIVLQLRIIADRWTEFEYDDKAEELPVSRTEDLDVSADVPYDRLGIDREDQAVHRAAVYPRPSRMATFYLLCLATIVAAVIITAAIVNIRDQYHDGFCKNLTTSLQEALELPTQGGSVDDLAAYDPSAAAWIQKNRQSWLKYWDRDGYSSESDNRNALADVARWNGYASKVTDTEMLRRRC